MRDIGAPLTKAEVLQLLAAWAIQVSFDAPEKFSKYGHTVYIPRSTIRGIRDVLEAARVDWRKSHLSSSCLNVLELLGDGTGALEKKP